MVVGFDTRGLVGVGLVVSWLVLVLFRVFNCLGFEFEFWVLFGYCRWDCLFAVVLVGCGWLDLLC